MKQHFTLSLVLIIASVCLTTAQGQTNHATVSYQDIIADTFEVSYPEPRGNTTLVLFGGFPQRAADIKREFGFLELAKQHQLTVLYMNYNRKLWLTEAEQVTLGQQLTAIFQEHNLPTENMHLGGFSSGGNVALLLANYLKANSTSLQPKGVFVVDSPVDLLELYRLSERNLAREYSQASMQESAFLLRLFQHELGTPDDSLTAYETYSPFTAQTHNIQNLPHLDGIKIRFYSEPDTQWWKEHRNNDPSELNAYWIDQLAAQLTEALPKAIVEYLTTENKGYRANGDRHPHSWSIVDHEGLVDWMLKE